MSRIDFTPAEITATSVRDSSVRSALVSKVCGAPRCTPPSPPVTNTRIPASAARRMVAATVVAPWTPLRDDVRQVAHAHLGDVGVAGEQLEVGLLQADSRTTVEDRDGRGHRAALPDDPLDLGRHLDVLRVGHAVADDRALQGDDGSAVDQRLGHFVGQHEVGVGSGHRSVSWSVWASGRASSAAWSSRGVRSGRTVCGLAMVRAAAAWPKRAASLGRAALEQHVAEGGQHRVAGAGDVVDSRSAARRSRAPRRRC